jgi:hypothetical protein
MFIDYIPDENGNDLTGDRPEYCRAIVIEN